MRSFSQQQCHAWYVGQICHDPHSFLGIHDGSHGSKVIRLWRPDAQEIYLEVQGQIVAAEYVGYDGVFERDVPSECTFLDYRIFLQDGSLAHDPYAFPPVCGDLDIFLFSKGVHYQLYDFLGANLHTHDGISGVKFAVWAPAAKKVSVIGDFNAWDGRVHLLRSLGGCGVWEIFIPGLDAGQRYKFEVQTQQGQCLVKADPCAFAMEKRPKTASIVANVQQHVWQDQPWMERRTYTSIDVPINVYEMHLGSWRGEDKGYRELSHSIAAYCEEMGFTHVELMPITEHPLDESWGYQVSGFYAVTSRYGTPSDFQYFVDYLHSRGIGVIIDWVAAHLLQDDFALASFDGSSLYEHEDPRRKVHPHWNTYIFNYGRVEVKNFLIASALFWLDKMHIDGLRVDAVASMLYLDYGREGTEWVSNIYGGKEDLEAIEFIKHLNSIVHERFPGVLMIAEESTSFYGVTHPLQWGGLGFDLKWNMGWMNDTLSYFQTDPLYRYHHRDLITFGLWYAFSEKFMLALSHDEVVHGKASLLSKMPGDEWQKFANLRLLYSYMMCHPGKKLFFMGGEIGQWTEWNCKQSIEWHILDYPMHQGMQNMVRDINHLYLQQKALWKEDFIEEGFSWVNCQDHNSVFSYLRKGGGEVLLCVHNCTPLYFPLYHIPLSHVAKAEEIFSSDREEYGGSGKINVNVSCLEDQITITLAPLATMIFTVHFAEKALPL